VVPDAIEVSADHYSPAKRLRISSKPSVATILAALIIPFAASTRAAPLPQVDPEARPAKGDADLRAWLENMTWHHGFAPAEMRAVLGISEAEIAKALARFDIRVDKKPRCRATSQRSRNVIQSSVPFISLPFTRPTFCPCPWGLWIQQLTGANAPPISIALCPTVMRSWGNKVRRSRN
jgi:hypothetical protein